MTPPTSTLSFAQTGHDEELARAELYGLLSRLWLVPPDADLLQQFALAVTQAPEAGGHLEAPWQTLVDAVRRCSLAAAATEHEALFFGVGKPEVFLYGSYYLSGGYYGKKTIIKAITFGGHEKTYQAWNGNDGETI